MGEEQVNQWLAVAEVYNQDEAQLISGLLSMAAIPVKIERETLGNIYGLTIGPLAKIQILVPSEQIAAAQKILAGQIDNIINTNNDDSSIDDEG
ncbi:MAG TPA: hypothetical protein DDW50_15285 [Firmicutes bacterium]|jgi:hypothetical protein|nr:hypothetical protein [Bacillota bacterium]